MLNKWYDNTVTQTADILEVDLKKGLTKAETEERIKKYGYNELKEKKKAALIQKIFNQLSNFLVIILILASIISISLGEKADSIVIISIVIINAVLGVVQESKAEKALEALKKMSAPNARVLRNGKIGVVPARILVPGDIVLIEAGDIVPADLRIYESASLRVNEASLTGESLPVEKDGSVILKGDIEVGDRENMAFMSTIVTYGRARGIVVATSCQTEIGMIADKIQKIQEEETPLQQNLAQLGKWLGIICIGVCTIVFGIGLLRGESFYEILMVAVSLAVAAIPEGLPAVVTIVLAMGMKKMVSRNAIVRKLLAVETLGCVDVICSDKTGTLTENEMTVKKIYSSGNEIDITGHGYEPSGDFYDIEGKKLNISRDKDLEILLSIGSLCNDSSVEKKNGSLWGIIGDPTEGSLVVIALKAGYKKDELNVKYPRLAEIPFDSDRKMMTTFHKNFTEGIVSFTKGAPDVIVDRCTKILKGREILDLTEEIRAEIETIRRSFANSALRVLAMAYRQYDAMPELVSSRTIENDMIFVGLMGMIDPARNEVKESIMVCRKAGIKPVMITGDHKDTAVAIAKELKLMKEGDGVLTGKSLDDMSDEELLKAVETTSVYARVSPEHKVRIVDALKNNGHIAAMTGDGVNDAMALKSADIGVAMGITGTDVAKGTAEIVLTDDNFASIVSAVEEGRIIYSNIRKFVSFLLSCNVGEILVVFIIILFNLPVPLVPIQLLWLNLVTDSFPALAISSERGEPHIMSMKPRKAEESILNGEMIKGIIVQSTSLTVSVLGAYLLMLSKYPDYLTSREHLMYARTYAFAVLISAELIRAYSSRSENYTLFKIGIFSNRTLVWATLLSFALLAVVIYVPFLRSIFQTVYLSINDWFIIIMFSLIPFLSGELYKVLKRKIQKNI